MSLNVQKRQDRFPSHALVELRRFKNIPMFIQSAVLLDISLGGFKIEFTGEHSRTPGDQFWLTIPLTPLGIYSPTKLVCKGECRWFDEKRCRVGGVFMHLSETDRYVVDQVVSTLKERNRVYS